VAPKDIELIIMAVSFIYSLRFNHLTPS